MCRHSLTTHAPQVIGSLVGLLGLIAAGIAVGVILSKSHKSSSSSNPNSVVKQANPNDPSTFVKDPNLKQSFYGLAYTPLGSQLPNCGNQLCEYASLRPCCFSDVDHSRCHHRYPGIPIFLLFLADASYSAKIFSSFPS